MGCPRISVVIPCRNEGEQIKRLLEALRLQDTQVPEVIVVDGASTDDTPAILEGYRASHCDFPLKVISQHSGGIPASLNAAIRVAQGEVIVRLDAHSIPARSYVRRAVDGLAEPGAAIVGGLWRIEPGRDTRVGRAIAQAVAHPMGAGDATYRIGTTDASCREVDTVPFGCFHKSLWEELGGFDERLQTNEDYDFNYRARLRSRRVVLDPMLSCVYVARPTLSALASQYFRYGWWKAEMLRKHPRALRWRQAAPAAFLAALVALSLASLVSPAASGMLAVLILAYLGGVILASVHACVRERVWQSVPVLPVVFAVIHLCWGAGFLLNFLSLGHWLRQR